MAHLRPALSQRRASVHGAGIVTIVLLTLVSVFSTSCGKCDGSAAANDSAFCSDEGGAGDDGAGATGGSGNSSGASGSGTGGANGGTTTGGGGGGGGIAPDEVTTCKFEDDDPSGCEFDGWQTDTALGAHDGARGVHPPPMSPGDEKSATYDCSGQAHSQIRFFLHPLDAYERGYSSDQARLELRVDGELYHTFTGDGRWREVVIDLPNGTHSYEFTAIVDVETQNVFLLDSFGCFDAEPRPGINGRVGFDDGFIPPALVQGEWQVDNVLGKNDGEAALHPPPMHPGDEKATRFTCNDEVHSQIRFFFHPLDAYERGFSAEQARLELRVDGELYHTFTGDGRWREVVIDLPNGIHSYEFTAIVDVETQNVFLLDGFACIDKEPVPGINGRVGFDDGFLPPELERGDWFVDNLLGIHEGGEAALHPPPMMPGAMKTTTITCNGEAHSQFRFFLHPLDAYERGFSAAQASLDLNVDGELYRTFTGDGRWREVVIDHDTTVAHTYEFVAKAEIETQNVFLLDSFVCE